MKKHILLALFPLCVYAGSPTIAQIEKAMQQGSIAQVEQMSKEAVQEHPQSAKAHYFLGQAYFNENKMAEANTEFITARKLDPKLSFTKKPEMFNDMLNRSWLQVSAAPAPAPVAKPQNKKTDSLNIIWLIIGTSLGLALGTLILAPVIKKPRKIESDLGPEFELEDEDTWKSTTSKTSNSENVEDINERIRKTVKRPSSVTRISTIRRATPQWTSQSTQQPTVMRESNNDGLLTGIIVGSMLSHHGHDSGNTTIINNVNNDYSSGSSADFENSAGVNWDWDSKNNSSPSFDTSPDTSSWGDSGGSSFDSSSSNNNW